MAKRDLVSSYNEYEKSLHRVSDAESVNVAEPPSSTNQLRSCLTVDWISFARFSKEAWYASGRILSTTSTLIPVGIRYVRASSRSRRLTLLRETALCLKRGTTRPIRNPAGARSACARGEAAARTSRCLVRMRFPSRAIRCSSAPRVIRARRGKPSESVGVLCSGVLIRNTNGELLAPLLPTTSKRCTSPFRFHARTETVRLEPPRVAWAVGWLSH